MLRRSRIALAAAALSITTFAIAAHAKLVSVEKGSATITAEAKPALGKFSGKLKGISAKEEGDTLVFSANLTRWLDMGMRDSHTREAFKIKEKKGDEKAEAPEDTRVKVVIEKGKLKMPEDGKSVVVQKGDGVPAQLTLNGKTIGVKVGYEVSRTGSDYHLKWAKFDFNYTKLGIAKISRMGVKVEETVEVEVKGMKLRDK